MDPEFSSLETKAAAQGVDLYQLLGGMESCRALSVAFYARVPHDPILGPMHPTSLRCARDRLAHYLAQFLGGPDEYAQERWSLSLREAHLRFAIGPKEREAWLKTMLLAVEDVGIGEPMRSVLRRYFEQASAHVLNQPSEPVETANLASESFVEDGSEPSARYIAQEVTRRWQEQRALEAAVAAVRDGEAALALELAESSPVQSLVARDHAAWLGLLAILSIGGDVDLLAYVRQKVVDAPELVRERYTYGRTLLHDVAGDSNLPLVEELLRLGADPNATDQLGKTPLYFVGNGCQTESGAEVVRVLVRAGATVDAQDLVKHCTALHMAARRGNVGVARALVECGANLEARDSLGDTPLRRAVNCGKTAVVAFLLSRGADVHSKGDRELTPRQVARGSAMKRLLQPFSDG